MGEDETEEEARLAKGLRELWKLTAGGPSIIFHARRGSNRGSW